MSLLINQLSGILDSIGRNEFIYTPDYLAFFGLLLIITLILFWVLIRRIRHVRNTAVVQLLIDTARGEIPYIEFSDHQNNWLHYKPQMYLANAFTMMKLSLRFSSTIQKHGARTWIAPAAR